MPVLADMASDVAPLCPSQVGDVDAGHGAGDRETPERLTADAEGAHETRAAMSDEDRRRVGNVAADAGHGIDLLGRGRRQKPTSTTACSAVRRPKTGNHAAHERAPVAWLPIASTVTMRHRESCRERWRSSSGAVSGCSYWPLGRQDMKAMNK
jgi:hypothetical protein